MKSISSRLNSIEESIFTTIVRKANDLGAVNLSQGSPDFDGPDWLKEMARESFFNLSNQYAPPHGNLNLRKSISRIYEEQYSLSYDWQNEITIVDGATQGIFNTIMALVSPGDEVIVMEPFYDSYLASIKMAGGIAKVVTLKEPNFEIPFAEIEKNISKKTKLLIFNTPHNPLGRVFSTKEMELLLEICEKKDLYIISDEVYEYLTFDGYKHVPMAKIKKAKERTITISSAGKTFSMTGWKIGWCLAPKEISKAIRTVHQYNVFCVNTQLQEAISKALFKLESYLPKFQEDYLRKRDLLFNGLQAAGLNPIKPQGTYFITCQINQKFTDREYVDYLLEKKLLAAIPCSSFYAQSLQGLKQIRFCFAKKDETLLMALEKLKNL